MASARDYMRPPVLIESDEPLSKVVGLLRTQKQAAHAIVTKEGKYQGVIDDRTLRRFQGNLETTKAGRVAHAVKKLGKDASPEEIVSGFLNSEVKVLPVLEGEKPVGIVPRSAALQILSEAPAVKGKRVSGFMSRPAITVSEDTTIAETERVMGEHGIYWLAVVDKRGKIAGVISTYDLATKIKPGIKTARREATFRPEVESNVQEEPVQSVMSPNVIWIAPETTVPDALKVMLDKGVSNLVVAEKDKPVGVFTSRDALEIVAAVPRQNVFIYGLRQDERMLQQSLVDEASAFIAKIGKSAPVDYVVLHLRSTDEGQKRRYQVRARVSINGHLHLAGTPDIDPHRRIWDASMAVHEVLDEIERIFYKHDKRGPVKERFERERYSEEE